MTFILLRIEGYLICFYLLSLLGFDWKGNLNWLVRDEDYRAKFECWGLDDLIRTDMEGTDVFFVECGVGLGKGILVELR